MIPPARPDRRSAPTRSPTGSALALLALAGGGAVASGLTVLRLRRLRNGADGIVPLELGLRLPGAAPALRVAVLGDSSAAGHGIVDTELTYARRVARGLAAGGRAVDLVVLAVDGATTADVVAHQLPRLPAADVVLVGVGANDALKAHSTVRVADGTRRLVAGLHRRAPGARVVLLSCPDLSAAWGLPATLRPAVGWRCRAVAAAQAEVAAEHGVSVLRLGRDRLPPEVFGHDGLHPGEVGHERLARRLLDDDLAEVAAT